MAITFTPVELDTGNGDRRGVTVFNHGRLAAVLSCLDEVHGDAAGRWFVEVAFRPLQLDASRTYASPDEFADVVLAAGEDDSQAASSAAHS